MLQSILQGPETLGTHVLIPEFENDRDQLIVGVPPVCDCRQRYYVPEGAMLNFVAVAKSLRRSNAWSLELVRVARCDSQIVTERRYHTQLGVRCEISEAALCVLVAPSVRDRDALNALNRVDEGSVRAHVPQHSALEFHQESELLAFGVIDNS